MQTDDDQFQMVIINFEELLPKDHPTRQLLSIIPWTGFKCIR